MVRCGHCMSPFDGLQGLSEDSLDELETHQDEQAEISVATVEQHGDRALLRAIPKTQWTVAVPDVIAEEPAPQAEYADTLAEPYSAALPGMYPDVLPDSEPIEELAEEEDFPLERVESVGAEREEVSDEVIEQIGSIVPSLPTDASEDEIGEPIDMETLRSFEAQVEVSLHHDPLDDSETKPESEDVFLDPSFTEDTDSEITYPQVLEEDVARLQGFAAKAKVRRVFVVLSIGLLVVMVLQYAWFMPEDMAMRYPQTRNLLDRFCGYTACTLAEQRDPAQVQVVSRDVRVHPKYEGALLVTAQLVNAANFVQPYPLMEFTLFNVNGQTIATRTFTPEEYVGPGVDIDAGMRPTVPTQIELDVLAPDEAAVSFEFRFL